MLANRLRDLRLPRSLIISSHDKYVVTKTFTVCLRQIITAHQSRKTTLMAALSLATTGNLEVLREAVDPAQDGVE